MLQNSNSKDSWRVKRIQNFKLKTKDNQKEDILHKNKIRNDAILKSFYDKNHRLWQDKDLIELVNQHQTAFTMQSTKCLRKDILFLLHIKKLLLSVP